MANFSKWKYWSDRGFPYTRQQCGILQRSFDPVDFKKRFCKRTLGMSNHVL